MCAKGMEPDCIDIYMYAYVPINNYTQSHCFDLRFPFMYLLNQNQNEIVMYDKNHDQYIYIYM
jgi:hypothetical protein